MERKFRMPRTVNEVYEDHEGRRQGMLNALTTERGKLYQLCDPAEDNLSLYSYPDGTWEVSGPAEEIPSELPEPCLGINFARDGMSPRDWLALVAAHTDAWLYSVAFFYTTNFTKQQRSNLFDMINNHPTVFEVVMEQASGKQNGSVARNGASKTQPDTINVCPSNEEVDEISVDEDEVKEDNEGDEEEETFCGACQTSYSSSSSEFWILCDACNKWFHGKCVKITASRAQHIDKYRCPMCTKKRPHP